MAETFKCYYTGAEVRLIYKGREYIFDTEKEAEEWFEEQEKEDADKESNDNNSQKFDPIL